MYRCIGKSKKISKNNTQSLRGLPVNLSYIFGPLKSFITVYKPVALINHSRSALCIILLEKNTKSLVACFVFCYHSNNITCVKNPQIFLQDLLSQKEACRIFECYCAHPNITFCRWLSAPFIRKKMKLTESHTVIICLLSTMLNFQLLTTVTHIQIKLSIITYPKSLRICSIPRLSTH